MLTGVMNLRIWVASKARLNAALRRQRSLLPSIVGIAYGLRVIRTKSPG